MLTLRGFMVTIQCWMFSCFNLLQRVPRDHAAGTVLPTLYELCRAGSRRQSGRDTCQDDKIFRAVCAGASVYLLKTAPMERIIESVREAYAGDAPMTARVARSAPDYVRVGAGLGSAFVWALLDLADAIRTTGPAGAGERLPDRRS